MPVGRVLKLVSDIQHARLVEIIADDLQAHGHVVGAKAAGDGHAGQSSKVYRDGVDVGQVHLHRIVALLAQLERG